MSKYDIQFKLKVVKQYKEGKVGLRAIAERHGLAHSLVRRWTAAYDSQGLDGLTKKYSHYNAQSRLQILQIMRDQGLSYEQTAIRMGVRSPADIAKWERLYHAGGIDALAPKRRGCPPAIMKTPPKQSTVPSEQDQRSKEELLAELEYLRMENAYLKKLRALVQASSATAPNKRKSCKN